MIKTNIEAEGSELILKNKAGDYVIIPKKYRVEVQDMIKEGCHSCIDALVETLPISQDYAENGTVIVNPDDKSTIKKKNVKIENKNIYDIFTEDEIKSFIEEDTRDTSESLKAQAKYRYYSNLIEAGAFQNDSTYQSFKNSLSSNISERMNAASAFAQSNPDFYESESNVRTKLGEEAFQDYLQTKRQLETIRGTSTEGTDLYSGAHGARSIALNINPSKKVVPHLGEPSPKNKIRTAEYKLEYNPKTKDYEYILINATKEAKYNR